MDYRQKELRLMRLQHRAYLKSDAWKAIRIRAFEAHGENCQRCGKPGTDVHHKTYIRWGGRETMEDLEILCRPCHDEHHLKEHEEKDRLAPSSSKSKKGKGGKKKKQSIVHVRTAFGMLTTADKARLHETYPGQAVSIIAQERTKYGEKCRKLIARLLNVKAVVLTFR